jgi:ATP-dependent Clp protease adapter protein ClpS
MLVVTMMTLKQFTIATALLLLVAQLATSFAPVSFYGVRTVQHQQQQQQHQSVPSPLFAGQQDGDSSSGAAIAKPAIKTAQKVETKQKEKVKQRQQAKTHDPISRRDEEFEEAPMFKLMLLGDDSYDAAHVVERMCAVVEDMDEDQAATVFQQANQVGKVSLTILRVCLCVGAGKSVISHNMVSFSFFQAMAGKYPLEIAELYKEQLIRSDPMIFSDLEKE